MTLAGTRTVARKMGITPGSRAHFVAAPDPAVASMKLPPLDVVPELIGEFDYIHLFATQQAQMRQLFPSLAEHLAAHGMLWVSWPKGRKLDTDLTLPTVIAIGYSCGLVESTCLSIDQVWSGLKFTHPKPGKLYHNSYGTLPSTTS